jgi:hypothetical protein
MFVRFRQGPDRDDAPSALISGFPEFRGSRVVASSGSQSPYVRDRGGVALLELVSGARAEWHPTPAKVGPEFTVDRRTPQS